MSFPLVLDRLLLTRDGARAGCGAHGVVSLEHCQSNKTHAGRAGGHLWSGLKCIVIISSAASPVQRGLAVPPRGARAAPRAAGTRGAQHEVPQRCPTRGAPTVPKTRSQTVPKTVPHFVAGTTIRRLKNWAPRVLIEKTRLKKWAPKPGTTLTPLGTTFSGTIWSAVGAAVPAAVSGTTILFGAPPFRAAVPPCVPRVSGWPPVCLRGPPCVLVVTRVSAFSSIGGSSASGSTPAHPLFARTAVAKTHAHEHAAGHTQLKNKMIELAA